MIIEVDFNYTQWFLPNKKCKKERSRKLSTTADIEIKEPKDFPVAFIVSDTGFECIRDDTEPVWGITHIELRAYEGKLYRPIRWADKTNRKAGRYPIRNLGQNLSDREPCAKCREEWDENILVILDDDRTERLNDKIESAEQYLYYDNKVWHECNEPGYYIATFGFGGNHGGTAIFLGNANSSRVVFNALERDLAIEYGVKVATKRGDTDYINHIQNTDSNIQVFMPEMVKIPFYNPVQHMTNQELIEAIDAEAASAVLAKHVPSRCTHPDIAKEVFNGWQSWNGRENYEMLFSVLTGIDFRDFLIECYNTQNKTKNN